MPRVIFDEICQKTFNAETSSDISSLSKLFSSHHLSTYTFFNKTFAFKFNARPRCPQLGIPAKHSAQRYASTEVYISQLEVPWK